MVVTLEEIRKRKQTETQQVASSFKNASSSKQASSTTSANTGGRVTLQQLRQQKQQTQQLKTQQATGSYQNKVSTLSPQKTISSVAPEFDANIKKAQQLQKTSGASVYAEPEESSRFKISKGFEPTKDWEEMSVLEKAKATTQEFKPTLEKGKLAVHTHLEETGEALVNATETKATQQEYDKMSSSDKLVENVTNVSAGLVRNIFNSANKIGTSAAGAGAFVSGLSPSEKTRDFGENVFGNMNDALKEYREKYDEGLKAETYDENVSALQDPSLFINPEWVIRNVTEQLPNIAVMASTGVAGAGMLEGGSYYSDRMTEAENANRELNAKDQIGAVTVGTINGLLEKVGFDAIFKSNPLFKKVIGEKLEKRVVDIVDNINDKYIKKISSTKSGKVAKKVGTIGLATSQETGTEYLQEIVPSVVTKVMFDEGGTWKEVMEQAHQQGLVAAGTAFGMSAPISTATTIMDKDTPEPQKTTPDTTSEPQTTEKGVKTTKHKEKAAESSKMSETTGKIIESLMRDDKEVSRKLIETATDEDLKQVSKVLDVVEQQGNVVEATEKREFIEQVKSERKETTNKLYTSLSNGDKKTSKKLIKNATLKELKDTANVLEKTKSEKAKTDLQNIKNEITRRSGDVQKAIQSVEAGADVQKATENLSKNDRQVVFDAVKDISEKEKAPQTIKESVQTVEKLEKADKQKSEKKKELLAKKLEAETKEEKKAIQEKIDTIDGKKEEKKKSVKETKKKEIKDAAGKEKQKQSEKKVKPFTEETKKDFVEKINDSIGDTPIFLSRDEKGRVKIWNAYDNEKTSGSEISLKKAIEELKRDKKYDVADELKSFVEESRKVTKTEKDDKVEDNKPKEQVYDKDKQGKVSDTGAVQSETDTESSGTATKDVSRYDRAAMLVKSGDGFGRIGADGKRITKKDRQLINEVSVEILTENDFSANPDDYTNTDKQILAAYTGAGGKESVGADGKGLLSEYYTPINVVDKMWEIAQQLNPNAETSFEPSTGTGRFISRAPKSMKADGIELQQVSGTIANILNPDSRVQIGDFQELFFDPKTNKQKETEKYDVIIGNPPFGERAGFLKGKGEESDINRMEEYFIKRGLDMLNEGGHLLYVVNSSFLTKKSSKGKKKIAKNGKLVSAWRLPEGYFEDTTIGTDIVVFKKEKATSKEQEIGRVSTMSEDTFYRANDGHIIGETDTRKNRFGKIEAYVKKSDKKVEDIKLAENLKGIEIIQEEKKATKKKATKKTTKKTKKTDTKKATKDSFSIQPKKNAEKLVHKDSVLTGVEKDAAIIDMYKKVDRDLAIEYPSNEEMAMLEYDGEKYYHDDVFYTGDVRSKLKKLKKRKSDIIDAIGEERYNKQVERMEKAVPEDYKIEDIAFDPLDRHIAERKVMNKYGNESTITREFVHYIRENRRDIITDQKVQVEYITRYAEGKNLPKGTKKIEGEIKRDAKRLFNDFVKKQLDPDVQKEIVDEYNEQKNSYVEPNYRNIPVDVENMTKEWFGDKFKLSDTQKEGISFLVNKGTGLIAYGVGVGKTHTLSVATKANMDRGHTKRPLLIVPKATVTDTWIKTLHELFPDIKINNLEGLQAPVVRKMTKERGEDRAQWIKDGELSVITHDGILRLGLTESEVSESRQDLNDAMWKEDGQTDRQLEKMKDKTDEIVGEAQKFATDVMFRDLGFDHLSVDEVHNFRKIFQGAKPEKDANGKDRQKKRFSNIIGGTPSKRAQQLFILSQFVQKRNGGRNVFLASATPFENHATEVYNILSLVARDRMKKMGIFNINDFFSVYSDFEVEIDRKLDGAWVSKEKMKSFQNLQSLQKLLREFVDKKEDPTLVRPDKKVLTPHLQMSERQEENLEKIQVMLGVQKEDGVEVDKKDLEDGAYLKASTYSIANSISPYFIDEYVDFEPTMEELFEQSPKIQYALETTKVALKNKKTTDMGVFLFFGKHGVKYHERIAEHMRKELGLNDGEVAYLSGKVTDVQKEAMKKKFNNGEIKVLIGGDQTKEGIDLQNNGFATINLALGWNPTEINQVEGRVWRQGNKNSVTPIIYPLVENSGDAMIYSKFEEKGGRINDLFSYAGQFFDVGEVDPKEKKLALITDPKEKANMRIVIDKINLENDKMFAESKVKEIENVVSDRKSLESSISSYKQSLKETYTTPESKKRYKAEIRKAKKKMERIDEYLKFYEITDIEAETENRKEMVANIDKKIKDVERQKDTFIDKYQREYEEMISKRKSIKDAAKDIETVIDDLEIYTDEEIAQKKAEKVKELEKQYEKEKNVMSSVGISKETFTDVLTASDTERLIKEIYGKLNPELQALVTFEIFNEMKNGEQGFLQRGFYDKIEKMIGLYSKLGEKEATETLVHESRHVAFDNFSGKQKRIVIDWFKSLSLEDVQKIFGKQTYEKYSNDYKAQAKMEAKRPKNIQARVTEKDIYLEKMADEAINWVMDSRYRGNTGKIRDIKTMYGKMLEIIRRAIDVISSVTTKGRKRRKAISLYKDVFSTKSTGQFAKSKETLVNLELSGFRAGKIVHTVTSGGRNVLGKIEIDESRYQKSGELKLGEKREAYTEAIKKVFGEDKLPPSLSKMVSENFKDLERRTNIAANKLEAIGTKTFQAGFSEGKKAGYLKAERKAITKLEGEILDLQSKIENKEYKNKAQKEKFEKDIIEKNEQHNEKIEQMRKKIRRQTKRHKDAKAKLRTQLRDKMVEYKEIRSEMVQYIKENLPTKYHGKYLTALRDGKTKKNLAKVMYRVDADIVRIQRKEAVLNIKKIMKRSNTLPIEFQYRMLDITQNINWQGMMPKTENKLLRIREYLKQNPDAELNMPKRILKKLAILDNTSYKDLTVEQLMEINIELDKIQRIGEAVKRERKINKIISINEKMRVLRASSDNFDIIKHSGMTPTEKRQINIISRMREKGQTAHWQVIMNMDAFVKKLDRRKENGANYNLIKRPIDVAFENYRRLLTDITQRFEAFMEEHNDITDENFENIGIYAISVQKNGRQKLISSGFSEERIDSVELTEKEMAIYQYMRKELDEMYPLIKKVFEKTKNDIFPSVENYFPFMTDFSNMSPVYSELKDQYGGIAGVKDKSFTQERKGGFNAVNVNAKDVFLKHMNSATYFVNMEETIADVREIAEKHRYALAVGEKAQLYIMRWLEHMERQGKADVGKDFRKIDKFLGSARNKLTAGILFYKLTTVAVQLGAVFNGVALIGVSAITGTSDIIRSEKLRKFIRKASTQMLYRVGDDPSFDFTPPKKILGLELGKQIPITPEQYKAAGVWGIKTLDTMAAMGTWIGAYKQHLESEGIAFDMDNIDKEAVLYADKVVRKTQATSDFKDIPPALRNNFGKALLQFQTFATYQTAFITDEILPNMKSNPKKAAWQATFVMLNMMWANIVRGLIGDMIWGDDDDDEETIAQKMFWEFAQSFPLIGGAMYSTRNVMKYGEYGVSKIKLGIPLVDVPLQAAQAFAGIFTAKKGKTKAKRIGKAIEGVATMRGFAGAKQLGQIYQAMLKRMK